MRFTIAYTRVYSSRSSRRARPTSEIKFAATVRVAEHGSRATITRNCHREINSFVTACYREHIVGRSSRTRVAESLFWRLNYAAVLAHFRFHATPYFPELSTRFAEVYISDGTSCSGWLICIRIARMQIATLIGARASIDIDTSVSKLSRIVDLTATTRANTCTRPCFTRVQSPISAPEIVSSIIVIC